MYRNWSWPIALTLALAFASSLSAWPLTREDVLDLLASGVGGDVIISQIDATGSTFELSVDDIIELKKAGASDELIKFMIETKAKVVSVRYYERYRNVIPRRYVIVYNYLSGVHHLYPSGVIYFHPPVIGYHLGPRCYDYPRRYYWARYPCDPPDPPSGRKVYAQRKTGTHRRGPSFAGWKVHVRWRR